jgi:uncharacterized protein (DUF58 family)
LPARETSAKASQANAVAPALFEAPLHVTPTFSTTILVTLATLLLGVAALDRHPAILGWGGAMLFGLAIGRTLTRATLSRARAAGFEMLWRRVERAITCTRQVEIHVSAELRNRSGELLVLERITPLAPPELRVVVTPDSAVIPPHSALCVELVVLPQRIGLHGIQGMTVVVRDDGSAFEAQLTFANPIVFEVLPRHQQLVKFPPRGGRGRFRAPATKTRPISGESLELRELREYQRADPLHKVAWKASARRGKLLVRDDEQEQHNVVHFVLDASVELWAGRVGESPLDVQIDRVASAIRAALRRGDRVGLSIVGSRTLATVPPALGQVQERKLIAALTHATTTRDHDRAGVDEQDAGAIVLEHLRPMDPVATKRLHTADIDAISRLAQRYLLRAPLPQAPEPLANGVRERILRRYLAAFGLPSIPRTTPDRDLTDRELVETLKRLIQSKPDRVVVFSPWPSARLVETLNVFSRRVRKARIELEWSAIDPTLGLPPADNVAGQLVETAIKWHAVAARDAGLVALRRLGVRHANYNFLPPIPRAPSE